MSRHSLPLLEQGSLRVYIISTWLAHNQRYNRFFFSITTLNNWDNNTKKAHMSENNFITQKL